MESIGIGEFRSNLKDYLKRIGKGEVIVVGGVKLMTESKCDHIGVMDRLDELLTKMELLAAGPPMVQNAAEPFVGEMPFGGSITANVAEDKPKCKVCDKAANSLWERWEESLGEDILLCKPCIYGKFGKYADAEIKKMKKLQS